MYKGRCKTCIDRLLQQERKCAYFLFPKYLNISVKHDNLAAQKVMQGMACHTAAPA